MLRVVDGIFLRRLEPARAVVLQLVEGVHGVVGHGVRLAVAAGEQDLLAPLERHLRDRGDIDLVRGRGVEEHVFGVAEGDQSGRGLADRLVPAEFLLFRHQASFLPVFFTDIVFLFLDHFASTAARSASAASSPFRILRSASENSAAAPMPHPVTNLPSVTARPSSVEEGTVTAPFSSFSKPG